MHCFLLNDVEHKFYNPKRKLRYGKAITTELPPKNVEKSLPDHARRR